MRFSTVLFDLDGTLIDSGSIIVASARHAALEVLGREIDEELVRSTIGGPGLTAMMTAIEPDRVEDLIASYQVMNVRLHDELAAFDDVLALLPGLRAEGRRVGVVTAKRRATVMLAFERFPVLAETVEVLVTMEDTERHKPDPQPVLHALEQLGASASQAAYVGDSPFDIRAGKGAGAFAIAVGWGGIHGEERLRAEEPHAFAATVAELRALLS